MTPAQLLVSGAYGSMAPISCSLPLRLRRQRAPSLTGALPSGRGD